MKINKSSMKNAFLVLKALESELKTLQTKEELVLKAYENCREQGFHLSCLSFRDVKSGMKMARFACSFSEHRNHDGVVVYVQSFPESHLGFSTGNIPTQYAYENATHFYNEVVDGISMEKRASKFIVSSFISYLSIYTEEFTIKTKKAVAL